MSTKWTADQMPDQTGRTAVVTGANSGLGLSRRASSREHGAQWSWRAATSRRAEAALAEVDPARSSRSSTWPASTPSRPSPSATCLPRRP